MGEGVCVVVGVGVDEGAGLAFGKRVLVLLGWVVDKELEHG